ncbi:adenylate/guanylate cyclase domain-containing protein [Algihabitans albus]|uniref:adenylate/guanylate cyclase domain-containing protein n=1 Tax=Algihabitans albus TaxID=2164067 RepID=UPI0013C3398A|nr:adenylate/guanylate cyclase domain-containing protein [Algihabitans albus]
MPDNLSMTAPRPDLRETLEWLTTRAMQEVRRASFLLAGTCQRLREGGLPIDRASLHILQLHPLFSARTLVWTSETGGTVQVDRAHGVQNTEMYLRSPIKPIYDGGPALRRRLEVADDDLDFPILHDLKAQGFTDYTIRPIFFSRGQNMAISFTTSRIGGFTDADIAALDLVLPTFSLALELQETQRTAQMLLETYIGPIAGENVLEGSIRRGDGAMIHAVVWYSDLRDFTGLSETHPLDEVLDVLNRYFDAICASVTGHGGEILKFIGDGVLAIFPIEERGAGDREMAVMALKAARQALQTLEDQGNVHCGIALHLGDVMYGNVGARDRLDFTVIGPAVNLATRLEPLTKGQTPPLVVSDEFLRAWGGKARSLGKTQLKGIQKPREAFVPTFED